MAPVERTFWRRLGHTAEPPEYGGDQPGISVFGTAPGLAGTWDLNSLPTLLRVGLTGEGGQELPGVTQPMLYIGMWRALFGWHTEDMELNSINYLHCGAPKLWCTATLSNDIIRTSSCLLPEMVGIYHAFQNHCSSSGSGIISRAGTVFLRLTPIVSRASLQGCFPKKLPVAASSCGTRV